MGRLGSRDGWLLSRLGGLLGLAAAVQVRRADLAGPQQLQPLGQDVLELRDGPALEQHVPVGPGRLLGLRLRLFAVALTRLGAAARALPGEGDLGLGGHRDLELVPLRAVVDDALARSELDAALVLEGRTAQ